MILWMAVLVVAASASEAEAPIDLETAVVMAQQVAADVVIAKEDVVLVDAEYMAALSGILPRADLTLTAGEVFSGPGTIESRDRGFRTAELIDVDDFVGSIGPFRDFRVGSASNPQFGLQLQISQLIFDGGRWWTQLARVDDVEKARRATVERILAGLRVSVAQAFYGHEAARQGREVIAAQVSSDQAQIDRARALLDAGRAKAADVAAAARNMALDRSELARKQLQVRQAARRLNFLIGRDAGARVTLIVPARIESRTGTVSLPHMASIERLRESAHGARPELVAIEAERSAAEKSVTIAEADYYPTVSLGASYRRQSRRFDRVYGDPSENYSAGVDLTVRWNLFEGRATQARVGQAEVNLRKLEAQRAELLRTVDGEVEDAVDTLQLQVDLVKLAHDATGAAEEALKLARGLFDEGRGTLLEVRDAELQILQARLSGITARLDAEIARESLARVLGTVPSALPVE